VTAAPLTTAPNTTLPPVAEKSGNAAPLFIAGGIALLLAGMVTVLVARRRKP
jgi:hypothetical protein